MPHSHIPLHAVLHSFAKWFFPVFATCIVFISCAQDRSDSFIPANSAYDAFLERADADAKKIIKADPFGTFLFSDGSSVGNNLSIELSQGELKFYVIGVDKDGKPTISDPYLLPKGSGTDLATEGVEVELHTITVGGESHYAFTVSKCAEPYSEKDRLPVGQYFDLKVAKGGPVTNGYPAIIGIDDGRNSKGSGDGTGILSIKDWKGAKIRIHRVDDATTDCVLSDKTQLPTVRSICFWSTGQPFWGKKFEFRYVGCP